jgi:hypothetical protein
MTKLESTKAHRQVMSTIYGGIALAAVLLALAMVGVGMLGSDEKKIAAVEALGMTEVRIGGYSFFGCAREDLIRSTFEARGANGKPVSGSVCGGLLKGYTVRMD